MILSSDQNFGRRGDRQREPADGGGTAPPWAALAVLMGAERRDAEGRNLVAPTTFAAVLAAAATLVGFQLAWTLLVSEAYGENLLKLPAAFWIKVAVGTSLNAALLVGLSQAGLRWLGWTSPLAFALGGAASGWICLGVWCLFGYYANGASALAQLAGSALCVLAFRLAAGAQTVESDCTAR